MIKLKNLLNETRLKDIVPDIIFIAAQYTRRNLDHIARQSWSSSADLIKQISDDYISGMSKKSFERDVNKLLKTYRIRETIKLQRINREVLKCQ